MSRSWTCDGVLVKGAPNLVSVPSPFPLPGSIPIPPGVSTLSIGKRDGIETTPKQSFQLVARAHYKQLRAPLSFPSFGKMERWRHWPLPPVSRVGLVDGFQEKLDNLKSEFRKELDLKEKLFKEQLQQKDKQIAIIEKQLLTFIPPPDITMTNFAAHKKDNDQWHSAPFFSHRGGYRMCLRVDANGFGAGKGTHVSMYVHLMEGEFDDRLQWPFRGTVTVELLNQRGNGASCNTCVVLWFDIPDGVSDHTADGRFVGLERTLNGQGLQRFIRHSELAYNATENREYILNDCLRFRVSKLRLLPV